VVQVGKSKISGRTISLQAAVHPGALAAGTQHLKKPEGTGSKTYTTNMETGCATIVTVVKQQVLRILSVCQLP
jgi:hypothetical protein